jgi:2-polyprenyl-3-methyl-5-hydroxy-6-metoxy-1,4-benzoquinol methylase
MTKKNSYHKYVFNKSKRKFVGNFEGMYLNEDIDPWHSSNLSNPVKKIHIAMLDNYNFNTILDYGCGKGAITHLLKKNNNEVSGVDISSNAIIKAKQMYGHLVDFSTLAEKKWQNKKYELIVCLEVLSYVKQYKQLLETFSILGSHLYLSLYIPKNPIGYVKNFEELIKYVNLFYTIDSKIIYNDESIFLFLKSNQYAK